ncbi:MAG TPA: helix-turn-helix domain-containing protein [Terriglobales bacterium]|nr:helix-turn-helix domain-containing protein [Terriglobales bacterium]
MSSPEVVLNQLKPVSECFVDATEAAKFLKINRRTLLHWARQGALPAHPLGHGSRKTWRFLVSELAHWLRARVTVN